MAGDQASDQASDLCDSSDTLWALTAGQRARYARAIVAMAIGTVFLLLVPCVLQKTFDALADDTERAREILIPAALTLLGFNAIHGFFTYLRGRWAAEASEAIAQRLRYQLYAHLERLPCAYHDLADTGDLVQRCSSDVETVRVFLAAQIVEIARVTLFLVVAMPIMLSQNLWMTGLALAVMPIIILFAVLFFRKVRRLFEEVDKSEGRLTTLLQENLTGIRVVQAFNRKAYEIERFLIRNGEFRDREYRLMTALSRYWAISDVLVFTQIGLVLFGGGYFVSQGAISIGTWVLFTWLARTIIWPVRQIGRVLVDSGKATVAIRRIQEILRESRESVNAADDERVEGTIEVRHLTFGYSHGQTAIDDLSLSIQAGETIALLGPAGAGKSTLVSLLIRLYDYKQGSIRIGGRELTSIDRDAVRQAFGVVLQDSFLFSRTIRDNVLFGRHNAADHEVEESARAADIHENILEFEDKYDTLIGERGVTLSGGQRQRLAIARALVKDPAFLALDDSLSAVDTTTESRIMEALTARKGRHTTILIAHRLSTARLADRIFMLDKGRLVQTGTHDELLNCDGPYRRLWDIQRALKHEADLDLSGVA
jgi:ATP-binding cassette subfamily B protein